jgi:hypothetical protein
VVSGYLNPPAPLLHASRSTIDLIVAESRDYRFRHNHQVWLRGTQSGRSNPHCSACSR